MSPAARTRCMQLWAQRTRRERALLLVAALAALLAALLGLGVLPAWRSLQAAPLEKARLQAQWQRMQALQAQAQTLLQQPRRTFNEAGLRASLAPLSGAQLLLGPAGAELRLQGAPPDALAQWLLSARSEAGVVVREAQLQRSKQDGREAWSGRLGLELSP